MLLGKRVASVDPAAHSITTDEGETIGYGKFVWATGGHPRMLPITGGALPGVQGVRTRADADAMKAARSEERRAGNECERKGRYRWQPTPKNKNDVTNTDN